MTLVLDDIVVSLGDRQVLHGVSLALAAGEVLGIVGPNGAGKSTLLRAACGLIAPARGGVTLDERPIGAWDKRALARRIAFLPQERTVHWPLAVRAVVALGRLPYAGASAADDEAIATAMRQADVTHLAGRPVSQLSGGERARVLLARTLAQDAAILVADEPVAGLDPAHQLDLFDRFRALADAGRTIVVALHDLAAAARHCDRLLLLHDGRQLALGPPRDVLTPRLLAAAYGLRAHLSEVDGIPIVIPLHRVT